ncbi:MAG: hypothetical protein LIP16_13960 [Clostridium sp.]|nr:hypothetical protein [Clostridium sp.]
MKMRYKKKRSRLGTHGSSMVYVIFLIALLSIFSCGYMAVSSYNMKAAVASGSYMEAQLAAKTIHTSFCEAVSSGDSSAMNRLWELFDEDVDRVREEYDAMMDEEEMEEDSWDIEGYSDEAGGNDGGAAEEPKESERFERYLKQALGHKEYVICGSSSDEAEDAIIVKITLTAIPMEQTAHVHTKVTCNGYRFSMKADIVFDNSDGAVMIPGAGRRGASSGKMTVYLKGNGVYRYYEDEDYDSP